MKVTRDDVKHLLIVGLLAVASVTWAQAPPNGAKPEVPPVLAEVDRLKIINASQAVEIWTLKTQQAAAEMQKARAEFDKLVLALTPAGWQMNEKLEFVKVEKAK